MLVQTNGSSSDRVNMIMAISKNLVFQITFPYVLVPMYLEWSFGMDISLGDSRRMYQN